MGKLLPVAIVLRVLVTFALCASPSMTVAQGDKVTTGEDSASSLDAVHSRFKAAYKLLEQGKYAAAETEFRALFPIYRDAALRGDATSATNLGRMYWEGRGVQADLQEA